MQERLWGINGNSAKTTAQQEWMRYVSPMLSGAVGVQAINPYARQTMGTMPAPFEENPTKQNTISDDLRISDIKEEIKKVEPIVTIGELRKAEYRKEKLKEEIQEIKSAYKDIKVEPIAPWTTALALGWQETKPILGNLVVWQYKNKWVTANRNLIKEAARKYNIPVELLAGVAWSEVGGDPSWFDDYGYPVRQYVRENIPEQAWWLLPDELTKDPYKTSFGYVSMQIKVAAETLGISDEDLDADTAAEIIAALNDQKFSIFIAAKHLSDLKQIDFPTIPSSELTIDDIATIASRYNIGSAALYERAATYSYGQVIKRRIPQIMEYVTSE